jgi:hypothetical protein
MMKAIYSLLICLCTCPPAGAEALITLKGKLVSMNPTTLVIETENNDYTVSRSMIQKAVNDGIKRTEVPIAVAVAPKAILKVVPRKRSR